MILGTEIMTDSIFVSELSFWLSFCFREKEKGSQSGSI